MNNNVKVYRLMPAFKDYLWGGRRLIDEYGFKPEGEICAEAWLLSCHPDGPSTVVTEDRSPIMPFDELIKKEGTELLGTRQKGLKDFPILIKLIDTLDSLSLQVHPSDEYALSHEGEQGKTELWYVVDAEEGAELYYGFKRNVTLEEFDYHIKNETLPEILNSVPVKKGDVCFLEPGVIHALG